MFTAVFFALAVYLVYRELNLLPADSKSGLLKSRRQSPKLIQAIDYAGRLFADHKYLAAEKAYLSVLKMDHKNVPAYTRLGIIYTRLKNLPDAIECFQIVSQLNPSAGSFYNLGLIYYENKNWVKSVAAFEKSIMFEPTATRYIGLAKSYQRMASTGKMLQALEQACTLEPSKHHLSLLAEAYSKAKQPDKAKEVRAKMEGLPQKSESIRRLSHS